MNIDYRLGQSGESRPASQSENNEDPEEQGDVEWYGSRWSEDNSDKYPLHNIECKNVSEDLARTVFTSSGNNFWRPEEQGLPGADFILGDMVVEQKNWASHVYLTATRVFTHVLPRFQSIDPRHILRWILVISSHRIGPEVRILLRGLGVKLVWVPWQVTYDNLSKVKDLWESALRSLFNTIPRKGDLRIFWDRMLILSIPILRHVAGIKLWRVPGTLVRASGRLAVALEGTFGKGFRPRLMLATMLLHRGDWQ